MVYNKSSEKEIWTMKKVWIGFGIVLVACFTVYGLVSTVNASSSPAAIAAETSAKAECPMAKQTAAGECSLSKSECDQTKQTASADCCKKDACEKDSAQTAQADSGCCQKQAAEGTSQTALNTESQ